MRYIRPTIAIFLVCGGAYLVYSYCRRDIDALPPLPDETSAETLRDDLGRDFKSLGVLFSEDEETEAMPLRIELTSERLGYLIGLASEEFDVLADGRIRFRPVHLAMVRLPEINTIKADVACLTFDQPVNNPAELQDRTILAAEFSGNIFVKNSRRNLPKDDALSLVTPGPVYYRKDSRRIWTKAPVRIVYGPSKLEPMLITADGMEMVLSTDKKEPQTNDKHAGKPLIGGVASLSLNPNVEMSFVGPAVGFLGSDAKAAPAGGQPQKVKFVITTAGPCQYNVVNNQFHLETPARPGPRPQKVSVTRMAGSPGQETCNYLYCERLDLQFELKPEVFIREAHATGREVQLILETEGLHGIGNDFFFNAAERVSTLKGTPAIGLRDGMEIRANSWDVINNKAE